MPASATFKSPVFRRNMLFEQVGEEVTRRIRDGLWKVGDMLPSDAELAADFQVSQGTVRRALKELTDKGILVRLQGRGTFVASYKDRAGDVQNRYVRLVPDAGESSLPTKTEQPVFEETVPSYEIAQILNLPLGEPVIHILRFHYAETGPVSVDEFYLRRDVFTRLTAQNMLHHDEPLLYAFFQNVCGVTIVRCEETAKAAMLAPAFCEKFGMSQSIPIIEGRRISYTYDDVPVEYRIQRSITEHYHLKLS